MVPLDGVTMPQALVNMPWPVCLLNPVVPFLDLPVVTGWRGPVAADRLLEGGKGSFRLNFPGGAVTFTAASP